MWRNSIMLSRESEEDDPTSVDYEDPNEPVTLQQPASSPSGVAAPLAGPSRTHYDYRKLSSSSRDVGVFRQIKQPDRREA